MPMVTRCPSCGTLFRVAPQQLQARRGQVRCGRCMTVFDGFAALAAAPDLTPPESVPAAARSADTAVELAAAGEARASQPAVEAQSADDAQAATVSAPPEAGAAAEPPPIAPADGAPAVEPPPDHAAMLPAGFDFGPLAQQPEAVPIPATPPYPPVPPVYSPRPRTTPTNAISADEFFLEQAHAKPRRSARAWTAGCAAALLALAGQAVYVYRAEFAASYPAVRPALAQLCAALGCSVPLPQRPRLINIEASDLQIVDPARPGIIQLTATLRNHAGHDVGYPALDLVLTSTREHTLARRIFLPAEYLDRPADVQRGLAASAETTIRLVLDTGELGAAGFRLDLMAAPAR